MLDPKFAGSSQPTSEWCERHDPPAELRLQIRVMRGIEGGGESPPESRARKRCLSHHGPFRSDVSVAAPSQGC